MEPVGIAYIVSSLKKAGHDVECLNKSENYRLREVLTEERFDFIATGGLSSQYAGIKQIISTAKKMGAKVILGGGIVTCEPELIVRTLGVDFAVIGEGEETVVELLSCIESGGDVKSVAGIAFIEEGRFVLTDGRKPIANLDSVPFPDWDVLELGKQLDCMRPSDSYFNDIYDYPRVYPLISSRSCPFLCTFCYHPLGQKYRKRSIDSIMDELEAAIPKYRINIVAIYDELFASDEKRLQEFCQRFRAFTSSLSWGVTWNCQMRVDKLTDNMLASMKGSGCFMVSYGFESYSQEVLKSMRKHITPDQIHKAIHMTLDRGISIQANFIFGDVAETNATASETLAFWKEHSFAGILLSFIFPCPDSYLYRYCIDKGIIKDRLHYIEKHFFDIYNMTQLSEEEFYRLRVAVVTAALKYYPRTVPLAVGDDSVKVRCPHCSQIIEYRNFVITDNNAAIYAFRPNRLLFNKMMYCRNCRHRFFAVSRVYQIYSKVLVRLLSPGFLRRYEKAKHLMSHISFFDEGGD